MLISEEIKPVALAVLDLCFSEGISQSVKNSVNKNFLNFIKFDGKTFLGLAMPNQYCLSIKKYIY